MNIKDIKSTFKHHNVQLSKDVIPLIDFHLRAVVNPMAERCKNGNVKRLKVDDFYIAVGDLKRNKY